MRYLARKFLSFVLPLIIGAVAIHGVMSQFTDAHMYAIGACILVLALLWFGKLVRRIIFFPINLLRRVLFRF